MLQLEQINDNKVVTITGSGTVTSKDYESLLPRLEDLLQTYDKLRFYIDLQSYEGIEAGAVWKDIKFDSKHKKQYGKTAIVADKTSVEWATRLSDLFIDAEVRYFSPNEAAEAWSWVNV